MAPRCEDEPSDPRRDDAQVPLPDDDAPSDGAGQDEDPGRPDEPDDEWAQIVARLGDIDVRPGLVEPRVLRPGKVEDAGPAMTGRDWDGTAQIEDAEREVDEQEHFVPPDPGPVLGGEPLLTASWLAVAAMPVLWLVVAIGWRSAPAVLLQASGVVFVLAVGVLAWRMPHRRDPDDGDDGAVV
ncbi:MAG: hypothetical protein KJ548_12040 [Actinobacteria bacterium]|nr:hypothetical protein [Actinomycetota bacterium]MBU4337292.1 hypothetical protein [Actinomycetota bacterium]MCG2802829.1 hypothetical protein [Cellulomonas sp.]